jgi:transcriptional regulator with XRE-family HTH domain
MTAMHLDDIRRSLLFPATLRGLRRQLGMSQKVVSLTLQIDPAQYCGIENGRRPPLDESAISNLTKLLGWPIEHQQDLLWAAAHDRAVRCLNQANVSEEAIRIASRAVRASRRLSSTQVDGLVGYLGDIEESALRLLALQPKPATAAQDGHHDPESGPEQHLRRDLQ